MPDFVDVLRDRFYDDTEHGPVMVPAGTYPVERDGGTLILILSGYLARAAFEPQRVGEGLYLLESSDAVREPTLVTFRRRIVGDTAEFLSSDLCEEGHPNQRLRVRLEEDSDA